MKCLVDANVALPLLLDSHVHRAAAEAWWDRQADDSVVFTLPVRMAVLRLLTNRALMGEGVLAPDAAWHALDSLLNDARAVVRNDAPVGIDSLWRAFVRDRAPTPNVWTDAWLAAFAEVERCELVTFDRGFKQFPLSHLRVLSA